MTPTSGARVYTDPFLPVNAGDAFFADGREFIDAVDETSAWHARQDSNFLV
ncbi:hypothetical protein NKH71_26710 [Mesorhizobium sp. M0983]|uniref:hypothetical protein n=1 Tax=Mesorhizobium sp. M0983 TaxID=2957040 RepID=UPI00333515A5